MRRIGTRCKSWMNSAIAPARAVAMTTRPWGKIDDSDKWVLPALEKPTKAKTLEQSDGCSPRKSGVMTKHT